MAISAYKQGKLKKNPLLGTSLAVDPNREAERESFQALYGEAREIANEGRSGMVKRLSERYQDFGRPHVAEMGRLGAERSRLAGIDTSAERMQGKKDWFAARDTSEMADKTIRRAAKPGQGYEFGDVSKAAEKHKMNIYTKAQRETLRKARKQEWGTALKAGGRKGGTMNLGAESNDWNYARKLQHAKKYYNTELSKKKGAYDKLMADNAARVASIGTLTNQYNQQRGILDAKANQYNTFLGA